MGGPAESHGDWTIGDIQRQLNGVVVAAIAACERLSDSGEEGESMVNSTWKGVLQAVSSFSQAYLLSDRKVEDGKKASGKLSEKNALTQET